MQIVVENLVKTFRVAQRNPGVMGAITGLLRRRYRTVRALDGVSFAVRAGELVGYIGPNGAGKSTTVKILSGILVPEAGRVEVLGRELRVQTNGADYGEGQPVAVQVDTAGAFGLCE